MKARISIPAGPVLAILAAIFSLQTAATFAATTIDAVNRYAYGANFGWLDERGDTNNGTVIGEYVCSGYLYSANVGWINLGNGTPTNGIYYQNISANDFGVNQDGLGNLRGDAWGANIGWIAFDNTGAPKVDLDTGKLSGYVWSANCGWISLSNAVAVLQTDAIQPGALAPDGLPVAWLLANFGTTNVDANADPDHDGMSNLQEYLAGTDPNNAASNLRLTGITRGVPTAAGVTLQWSSVPTRFYAVQQTATLATNFADYAVLSSPGVSSATLVSSNATGFYRIRAFRPLTP